MAADATTTASALRARAAEFRNRAEKLRELLVVDDEPEEGITRDVARNLLRILVEQNAMDVAGEEEEEEQEGFVGGGKGASDSTDWIVDDAAMEQEEEEFVGGGEGASSDATDRIVEDAGMDLEEGEIVDDAGMDLEEGEIVEDAAMAQEQGEEEEVEGKQDEVMVDGKRIPSELWDLVSLDDDEIASAQEVARARIRHAKEMEKVWLHLSHIDHDDFRALDSACLDYLSIKRFSEPILQASELLDTIRSRDWASALERRAAELDTEAASLET
uniref:Uncharacterized protein n=1 Tax=Oryza nivara TaxID=4536 RepID=A0A0E0J2J7_ORYNI